MRPGWNSTRRNRNIGTAKQGYGQDNRMVIPRRSSPFFYEDLTDYSEVVTKVHCWEFRFIVEHTRPNCVHACTVDDLVEMLHLLPVDDIAGIDLVVLRQPKRKEELLRPCWGRLSFDARVGPYAGSAIFLESVDLAEPIRWSKSLSPSNARELERLREDGFEIETTKRHHIIKPDLTTVRSVQLFRTLPHEIGHWVHWAQLVKRPARENRGSEEELEERYFQKTQDERESFAHRYADERRKELIEKGRIPFERRLSNVRLGRQGLRAKDFALE